MDAAEYRNRLANLQKLAAQKPKADPDNPKGDPMWETLVGAGVDASEDDNERRWYLGGLAAMVKVRYGESNISDFSESINQHTRTMREYKEAVLFYDTFMRQDFSDKNPHITYSHFRTAMRLGKNLLKHLDASAVDEAWQFLTHCADNSWSPDRAEYEASLRMVKPEDEGDKNEGDDAMKLTVRLTGVKIGVGAMPQLIFSINEGADVMDELSKRIGSDFTMKLITEQELEGGE